MGDVIDMETGKTRGGGKPPWDENELYTQKHEDFAMNIVSGLTPRSSATLAGFSPDMGKKLLARSKVKARIAAMRERVALRAGMSLEKILNRLEEMRVSACTDRQYSAAINAAGLMAKMLGYLDADRRGDALLPLPKPSSQPTDARELTVEEWNELFAHKSLR
jgi:hypothetical protein